MKPRSRATDTNVTKAPPAPRPVYSSESDNRPAGDVARSRQGLLQNWVNFWLLARDPSGLHVLRVLSGLVFLGWLLAFAGHVDAMFGLKGWADSQTFREIGRLNLEIQAGRLPPGSIPAPTSWSLVYLCGENSAALHGLYWGSIAVLLLFTLGIAPRLTAVGTWLVVASFIANPATTYDGDYLILILAFYLMIGYLFLGQWSRKPSIAERILGPWDANLLQAWFRRNQEPAAPVTSHVATAIIRLLQVHFCIVIVTAAVHKLQSGDWWSGVAFWYPMHEPFATTNETMKAYGKNPWPHLFTLSLAQYLTLAWQVFFPMIAWRDRPVWRIVLLGGAVIGWLGLAFMYQLPLFGPVLLVACLAYLTPGEWRWLLSWQQMMGSTQQWLGQFNGQSRELAQSGKR